MKRRTTTFVPVLLILFQGCITYQKTSVPLSQAHNKGMVRLISESGQMYKYKNIELVDSIYYGMGREYISPTNYITPAGAKTPIDSTSVSSIFLKDKKKSTRRTVFVAIFALPVAFVFTGVVVNLFGIW